MSSNVLKLIPIHPYLVPGQLSQDEAKKYLIEIFNDLEIEFTGTEDTEFVDQGANFENVLCNYCCQDITDFWQTAMNEAHEMHFENLSFITPCCHRTNSLNDLQYNWPAGFAKFQIAILDSPRDMTVNELIEVENRLGAKIKRIWAHY